MTKFDILVSGKWTPDKPVFNTDSEECLLIVASQYKDNPISYDLFQILKMSDSELWYWGITDADGEEWGDYEDLHAELYLQLPLIK